MLALLRVQLVHYSVIYGYTLDRYLVFVEVTFIQCSVCVCKVLNQKDIKSKLKYFVLLKYVDTTWNDLFFIYICHWQFDINFKLLCVGRKYMITQTENSMQNRECAILSRHTTRHFSVWLFWYCIIFGDDNPPTTFFILEPIVMKFATNILHWMQRVVYLLHFFRI